MGDYPSVVLEVVHSSKVAIDQVETILEGVDPGILVAVAVVEEARP